MHLTSGAIQQNRQVFTLQTLYFSSILQQCCLQLTSSVGHSMCLFVYRRMCTCKQWKEGHEENHFKNNNLFFLFCLYCHLRYGECVCVENLYLLTLTPHHLSELSPTTLIAVVLMGVQKSAEELRGRRQVVACVNLLLDLFKAN